MKATGKVYEIVPENGNTNNDRSVVRVEFKIPGYGAGAGFAEINVPTSANEFSVDQEVTVEIFSVA